MPPPLVAPFTKMSGAGNDFLVLDNRFLRFSDAELAALARRFCPRRTGVGADGLLALDEPDVEGADGRPPADFRLRYRNADGSAAAMCGNGARCLARFARLAGIEGVPSDDGPGGTHRLTFDTDAGRYTADVPDDRDAPVRLFVPSPARFGPVGLRGMPVPKYSRVHAIWTGTEHAVLFVPDVGREDVPTVGGRIRYDETFRPAGTNVDFVQVLDAGDEMRPAHVRARTYEKGVECETLACGTGALAAALAARLAGLVAADVVEVEMPGGTLRVGFRCEGGTAETTCGVTLDGPADVTFQGTLELDAATLAG